MVSPLPHRPQPIATLVKTRRRRRVPSPPPPSSSPSPPTPPQTHPIRDDHLLSNLPDHLMSHSLLTPAEERRLLFEIRFLREMERARDAFKSRGVTLSTDVDIAAALSLTREQVAQRHRKAIRARNRLVAANMRLVCAIARKVHRLENGATGTTANSHGAVISGVSSTDLVQEGGLALIRAAERFDVTRADARFSTYAAKAVWSACRRAATPSSCIVTLPERLRRAVRKRHAIRNKVSTQPGRDADTADTTDTTTAEYTPPHLVSLAERHIRSGVSLDERVNSRSGVASWSSENRATSRGELLPCDRPQPEDVVGAALLRTEVRVACYEYLSPRDADIVVLRFGLNGQPPMLSRRIAFLYKLSEARIAQVVAAAQKELKQRAPQLEKLLLYEM